MSILVFGANGQVGWSLQRLKSEAANVHFIDRQACDLADVSAIKRCLDEFRPELVINAAAYTQVDQAETESALAHRINGDAVAAMASYVAGCQSRLIHLSTDFVFDGRKQAPYLPEDLVGPQGAYGESKLAGEVAALELAPAATMIIRTAWVYSEHGNNFVKTMLRLMAERDSLGVVNDQMGSPTYASNLADVIWQIDREDLFTPGIYHWTDAGGITWYDFAMAIHEIGLDLGLLKNSIEINAITTADYPTPAARPAYSVLDNEKLSALTARVPMPWKESLHNMLKRYAQSA